MIKRHPLASPDRTFLAYLTDNINAVGDLASDNARTMWEGLCQETATRNCDLLAVVGGASHEGFGSRVYDLITPESADGFIAWIAYAGEQTDRYFSRFSGRHLVSLSSRNGDHPAVTINDRPGMEALVRHLVQQHGCRRIAFMPAVKHHPAAEQRLATYRATLAALDIPFDAQLVTPNGPWEWQTGVAGVQCLLDERGLQVGRDLDAIMCASDRIAMGVLAELARRGIRVPEDIALTGFNNLLEAQSHVPSVTTVTVPFLKKARQAVALLCSKIRGEPFLFDSSYLEAVPVIGESCGCGNKRLQNIAPLPSGYSAASVSGPLADSGADFERYCAELAAVFQTFRTILLRYDQAGPVLIRTFNQAVVSANPDLFVDTLLGMLQAGHYAFMDQLRWQDVLSVLRKMLGEFPFSVPDMATAEFILDKARLAVMDRFSRIQTEFRLRELRQASRLRHLGSKLGFSSDVPTIMDILAQEIPLLGIPSIWLAVFDDRTEQQAFSAPAQARLLLAIEDGLRFELTQHGLKFSSRQLLPEGFRRTGTRKTFVLFPLAHGEQEFGFALFEMGPDDGSTYEALAFSIGNALKAAFLRGELERRTLNLELSIYELARARNNLVEAEKLAALGELVAGVAHEINTPVGIGVTAVSTLAEAVKRLQQGMDERNGRAVRAEAEIIAEGADMAMRNLLRANVLIESFKQVAVDQSHEEQRHFELGTYLVDVLRSLEPRLRPGRHEVQVECAQAIELTSYPGAFAQIMSNLVLNSVIHGFESRYDGLIRIVCRRTDEHVEISYRDNGAGMDTTALEKMFHPFFTTKRGQGGTGLGMHIVYNLVTQRLRGSIRCESRPGEGVHFLITLPL